MGKISDSVLERLKGEISGEKKAPPPPPPPTTTPTPAPPAATETAQPQVWQRPIIQYIEEPSISALRVKAEKEEEMKNLDDYWKERLQKQEETFIANSKLTEEEILKNAKYVETLFKPAASGQFCRDSQSAVESFTSPTPGGRCSVETQSCSSRPAWL